MNPGSLDRRETEVVNVLRDINNSTSKINTSRYKHKTEKVAQVIRINRKKTETTTK